MHELVVTYFFLKRTYFMFIRNVVPVKIQNTYSYLVYDSCSSHIHSLSLSLSLSRIPCHRHGDRFSTRPVCSKCSSQWYHSSCHHCLAQANQRRTTALLWQSVKYVAYLIIVKFFYYMHLHCYLTDEGVYVNSTGGPIKDTRLQWGEIPSSIGKPIMMMS